MSEGCRDGDGEQDERREDDALDEAAGRGAFGEVAECGRDAPAQDDEQDEESVERADENWR